MFSQNNSIELRDANGDPVIAAGSSNLNFYEGSRIPGLSLFAAGITIRNEDGKPDFRIVRGSTPDKRDIGFFYVDTDYHKAVELGKTDTAAHLRLYSPDNQHNIILDTLNGSTLENTTINGVLDVTPRRCYRSQMSGGWYRVLTFAATSADYARGATGNEIVFHITRRRTTAGEETHEIKMLCQYDNISFVDEVSKSIPNYQRITKIRYTYDGTNGHVDIYAANTSDHVTVDFEVYCEPDYQKLYTAESLPYVGNSPSGETVLTEYTFVANTFGSETPAIYLDRGTITSGGAVLDGRIVHLNIVFTSSFSATNTPRIAMLSNVPLYDTALSCIDITSGLVNTITAAVPCGVSAINGGIYMQNITNGHIYAITGSYFAQ
jgi:hypothetical protein